MSERLRWMAREVFAEALAACTVGAAVARQLALEGGILRVGERRYDLRRFPDVRVVAIGKAGGTLFGAVRPLLVGARDVRAVVARRLRRSCSARVIGTSRVGIRCRMRLHWKRRGWRSNCCEMRRRRRWRCF